MQFRARKDYLKRETGLGSAQVKARELGQVSEWAQVLEVVQVPVSVKVQVEVEASAAGLVTELV